MFEESPARTRVKICGLTNLQDARFASGEQADFLGFIFYEGSKRYIEPSEAGAIIHWLEGPATVGVFVNEELDTVNDIARRTGVDYVQLHGEESPEYCGMMEKKVIKTFRVNNETSPEELKKTLQPYHGILDYFLFDTKVKGEHGGTGQTFDWNILKDVADDTPFFLAGGITPENVKAACNAVQPFAIDLSSGVEMEPGIKDYDKIEQLFEGLRQVWTHQEES